MDAIYTIFHFIVAISILVSIHEFGHFWVARRVGVKVIRFSVGFGKPVWSFQKTPDSTEYVVSAIPLGGYVKMVDEREGEVDEKDLPYAFNRQSLIARTAIVAAGPIFNLLLAIVLLWGVFCIGETGIRPILESPEPRTLAAKAGFKEGEEILSVNDKNAPTWSEAIGLLMSFAMNGEQEIRVAVKNSDEIEALHILNISQEDVQKPKIFYEKLGLKPLIPVLKPVIGEVIENEAAAIAGLQKGDLLITADAEPINDWMQWVEYVKNRPEVSIQLIVERDGVHLPVIIIPKSIESEGKDIGRIGAKVDIPKELKDYLRVEYSLSAGDAFVAAIERTWFYSISSLQMMGKMLIGRVSTDNLSGPISIAQIAGQSAEMGLVPFLKFLAVVSISLGVLNLLPIPMLDGGHLMFFAIEAIKGSAVSEKIQIFFQQVGLLMLLSLMVFAFFIDIERLIQ